MKILKCTNCGLFANVNKVLRKSYRWYLKTGKKCKVIWPHSPYSSSSYSNTWEAFFKQPFQISKNKGFKTALPAFFMTPRIRGKGGGPRNSLMIDPQDRGEGKKVINHFLEIHHKFYTKAKKFKKIYLKGSYIAVHARGPGRKHGATQFLKRHMKLTQGVPFWHYFKEIDKVLESYDNILICSDAQLVIEAFKKKYGEKVVTYDAIRENRGEAHEKRAKGRIQTDGYKLGEDMIVEMLLMSTSDFFIHGNSNVSNFIRCFEPTLKCHNIFSPFYDNFTNDC